MLCTFCGGPISDQDKFCTYCGSPVPADDAAPCAQPDEAAAAPVAAAEPTAPEPAPAAEDLAAEPAAAQEPACQTSPLSPEAEPYAEPAEPEQPPQLEKRTSPVKKLAIGGAALLLVLCLGFGIWLLLRFARPDAKLLRAAVRTGERLTAYIDQLPNLKRIRDDLHTLDTQEAITLEAAYTYQFLDDPFTMSLRLHRQQDRRMADLSLQPTERMAGRVVDPVELRFYADPAQIQISSQMLLDGTTYCIKNEDLSQRWNSSALAELTGIELPEQATLSDLLGERDALPFDERMAEAYGEDWSVWQASVRVESDHGQSHFDGEGWLYTVRWDDAALKRMQVRARREMETGPLAPDTAVLALGGDKQMYALLYQFDEWLSYIKNNQFYVNKVGELAGIWLDTPQGGLKLQLCGDTELWSRIELTTDAGQLRINLDIDQTQLAITAIGPNQQPLPGLRYQDDTGAVRLLLALDEEDVSVSGTLLPKDGGAELALQLSATDPYLGKQETMDLCLRAVALEQQPEPIEGETRDILDLQPFQLQFLINQITIRLNTLLGMNQ